MTRELEACFIIHTRAYRENSLLVELFSLNYGRISMIARGVKAKNSPLKSKLQLFVPLRVTMAQGHGQLWYMRDCQAQSLGYSLAVPNIFCGTYLNELLYYLYKQEEGDTRLFASYIDTLQKLSSDCNVELSLRLFERCLLDSLGYGIEYCDTQGNLLEANNYYSYRPGLGFVYSNEEQGSFLGSLLNSLDGNLDNMTREQAQALKYIHHKALDNLLEHRTINSRNMYSDYLKQFRNDNG